MVTGLRSLWLRGRLAKSFLLLTTSPRPQPLVLAVPDTGEAHSGDGGDDDESSEPGSGEQGTTLVL